MDYHHRSRDECDAEKADHIVGDIETHTPERKPLIPRRAIVAVMVFLGAVFFYMVRSNFSLNLLAMVEKTDANGTVLAGQPDYGPRIRWTVYEQSMLLGAFFYGYGSAAVPIGLLVEKYGIAKAYICVALLVCTVLEVLSPWAAQTSFRCMFIVRLVMGLMQSAYYPATHKLYSKWAPMNEMGVFCFANLGSSFGTLITWTFTGYLIESAGWLSSFYFPGAILAAFTLAWYLLVFETPDVHPSITCREKEYIAENRPNMAKTNTWPPLWSIATSPPAWALLLLQFGSDWGFYFVLTGVPKFLNEVLGFQIASTGMLACLPYLSRWLMSGLFGVLSDACVSRKLMSITNLRKVACVFSHILPGVFVLGMAFVSDQPYVCIAFMTISLGFNGAIAQSVLCNYHDLAPNYATTMNAIMNGIASCGGFLTPLIVAYFTAEKNDIGQWQYVFMIGAAVYITPAIIFMFIGTGEVQPWNDPMWMQCADDDERPAHDDLPMAEKLPLRCAASSTIPQDNA